MKVPHTFTFADYFIWNVIFLWLIIDSVTGFFSSKGINLPLSQFVKLGVLGIIVVRLSSYKKYLWILCVIIIYISYYFTHLAVHNYPLTNSFLILSKFLSLIIFYFYFKFSFLSDPKFTHKLGTKAFVISFFIIFFNVILGLMGYGVSSYKTDGIDAGVKGYFYAGNELGGIMAVIAPISIVFTLRYLKGYKKFLSFILILMAGIAIGTKTCILVTILSALIVPYMYSKPKTKKKAIFFIVVSLAILIYVIIRLVEESELEAIARWKYFYDSGGVERLILSGREVFWKEQSMKFYSSSLFSQLFGLGSEGKIIERDHMDSLIIYGYFGAFLICSFMIYLLFIAIFHKPKNNLTKTIILSDIFVLLIGYFAGHVWFSAMASVYIALINAFVYWNPYKISKRDMLRNM